MMKYSVRGFCLILCVIYACIFFNGCADIDFKLTGSSIMGNSIFVKTKAVGNTDISYLKLNGSGDFKICGEFEPNVNEYYITDGFWLDDNSIEEAFENMGDSFFNSKLEKVAIPRGVKKALCAVDRFEGRKKHWIWVERVFVDGDKYYISVGYNVNWQTPYSLLEYDEKKDSLKEIMYISNERIIGIKLSE